MKRVLWVFVLFLAVAQTAMARQGRYLVRLNEGLSVPPAAVAKDLAYTHGVTVTHVYGELLKGFAFRGTEAAAQALARDSRVRYVEEAAALKISGAQTQTGVGAGLDRIDQRRRLLDGRYVYNETGAGRRIYIVDTGLNPVSELSGRIVMNETVLAGSTADVVGHGTSVATIAAGSVHGVAKQAEIASIKVTNGTEFPADDALSGLELVASGPPGVVNLSWASVDTSCGPRCRAKYPALPPVKSNQDMLREAVLELVNRGMTVVTTLVSPGRITEPGKTPCDYEPARTGGSTNGLITVSAVDLQDSLLVQYEGGVGYVSGSGPCVDILAPGLVLASSNQGNEITFSGTSAAVPLVSGVAALVQQRDPSIALMPGEVEARIVAAATRNILGVPADTRNFMLSSLPRINIPLPGSVQASQVFDVSITPIAGATYLWNVTGGTIVAGGSTPTVTIRAGCSGGVQVDLVVDAPAGRSTGYASATILMPTATVITGETYINAGGTATLQAALTGIGPWTVTWSDGFVQTVSSSPATHTVSPASTQTYRVDAVSAGGCNGTASGMVTVTVTDCVPASASIILPSTAYSSAWVWASVAPDDGAQYQWGVTNGSANWYEGSPAFQFRAGCIGSSTVNVTVTRSCGMQSTGTASVTIVRSNAVVSGSRTISAGQSATIRADYTGSLPWSVTWSDGVSQYNINSSWVTRNVTPSTTRTYTITDVRDPLNCLGTFSGSATITVQ